MHQIVSLRENTYVKALSSEGLSPGISDDYNVKFISSSVDE